MDATRAVALDEIHDALSDALAANRPALIEVSTDPDEPQACEWMHE